MSVEHFEQHRREMVAAIKVIAEHLAAEVGKTALQDRVLQALAKVPRHEFVPIEVQPYAYLNRPLPFGFDKTISQPLTVAVMTDLLELKPDDVVLEIGTGLGYQAAVLAELAGRIYSVEIIDELAQRAVRRLKREGYTNVEVRVGNGYSGWPEQAPFDKIIVTAAHWHHARFDLESGCTFDLWADDVPICPVELRNGEVMRALGLDASRLLVVPDSMRQIAVCQTGHANTDPSLHRDGLVVAGVATVQRLLVATYCCFVSVRLSLGVGREQHRRRRMERSSEHRLDRLR